MLARHDAGAITSAFAAAMDLREGQVTRKGQSWSLVDAMARLGSGNQQFQLFAALRLLEAAQPSAHRVGYARRTDEEPVRLDQSLLLEFASAEISSAVRISDIDGARRPVVIQFAFGLFGPNGALPYAWTEYASQLAQSGNRAERDDSFLAWINVLQRRQTTFFYRAWSDTQSIVGADRPADRHPVADRLRAIAGLACGDLATRGHVDPAFKLAFSAVLSRRVRSPEPLAAMLSSYFATPVRIEEFTTHWLDIPKNQRTRLGDCFSQLGHDAVIGTRVWDCSSRFTIVVGPGGFDQYVEFLPGGAAHARLRDLVSLYAGPEFEWELVPVLDHREVPRARLDEQGPMLGWSSWLGVRQPTTNASDLRMVMTPALSRGRVPETAHRSSVPERRPPGRRSHEVARNETNQSKE